MWKEFGNDGASRRKAIWRERKEEGATLQAIGDKYGVTKERVRQIVAKRDREIKKEQTNDR
jgi:DNA-directed RNA polymerase sigma subunit (sigma70/sigma32)